MANAIRDGTDVTALTSAEVPARDSGAFREHRTMSRREFRADQVQLLYRQSRRKK